MDQKLIQRIKDEITNDPDKKGYAGKDALSIADLMNSPTIELIDILQTAPVPDPIVPPPVGTVIGQEKIVKDAPALKLISGISEVPNVITADQVTAALK